MLYLLSCYLPRPTLRPLFDRPKQQEVGSVVGWGTMLQAGRSRDRVPIRRIFSISLILPAPLWPWGGLSLQRKWVPGIFLMGKGRPARRADNFTLIFQPIIKKMWEPQRLATLWVAMVCYRDSFTITLTVWGDELSISWPCRIFVVKVVSFIYRITLLDAVHCLSWIYKTSIYFRCYVYKWERSYTWR
jgi:hypothetical protein